MKEVTNQKDMKNVCRLCLSSQEPKSSVFGDQSFSAVPLVTKIQTYLSIEISANDKVSTSICTNCVKKINNWHTYKEFCLFSQQHLKQYLNEKSENQVPVIKTEPLDHDEPQSPLASVVPSSDDGAMTGRLDNADESAMQTVWEDGLATVKSEIHEIESTTAEVESVASTELLVNPMALTMHKDADRLMEADSTQKSSNAVAAGRGSKKKARRGPLTHYRGLRRYKQRCSICQIYLHSKYSYMQHMDRFHSGKVHIRKKRVLKSAHSMEMDENLNEGERSEIMDTETIEDEFSSMEKDTPLTPVQQNIISQLKTFSCYACRVYFMDRRSTLNHIRQHMPDLRPFTCIACLTEFADRSIYKLHCSASFQCAMKIAMVVPIHGTEKYFTCNMCLKSFANRKELLDHLTKHSNTQYEGMVPASPSSPPRQRRPSNVGVSSFSNVDKIEPDSKRRRIHDPNIPAPYNNGDPVHNNECVHCGMIYKHKVNEAKHESLCRRLPPESRICYRCVHCGLTFLVSKKFVSHALHQHKKRVITCHRCYCKFKPAEFLLHYKEHYTKTDKQENDVVELNGYSVPKGRKTSCALCPGSSFPTPIHLTEHRKLFHPNAATTYPCTICRRTFDKASILEAHMNDHEQDGNATYCVDKKDQRDNSLILNDSLISIKSDPGITTTECQLCGKVFANYPNLRRHIRLAHDKAGRFNCFTCAKTFVREDQWMNHVEKEHRSQTNRAENCPQCGETFDSQQELLVHRRTVHGLKGELSLACDICGKVFASETSLKIHRGHHFRVNSRLSIGNMDATDEKDDWPASMPAVQVILNEGEDSEAIFVPNEQPIEQKSPVKSPRAKKSFPNGNSPLQMRNLLQCQVCDDTFNDVGDLRKHLWDVHCARNKPEKPFVSGKLTCELCTNVLPDEESFASHMKWHESNPILSGRSKRDQPAQCDICGKYYSNTNNLRKHKRRHKASLLVNKVMPLIRGRNIYGPGYTCGTCQKVFAERSTLMKHRAVAHPLPRPPGNPETARPRNIKVEPKMVRPKMEFESFGSHASEIPDSQASTSKKTSVMCSLCRKMLPSMKALFKHRQIVHKVTNGGVPAKYAARRKIDEHNGVPCTMCGKYFSNMSNMKQHFTKKHTMPAFTATTEQEVRQYKCSIEDCNLTFTTVEARESHERNHSNVIYKCALCPRYLLNSSALTDHMFAAHKTNRISGYDGMNLCKKIDLEKFEVKGAIGRECPLCRICYPNHRALKIHYLKKHEGAV